MSPSQSGAPGEPAEIGSNVDVVEAATAFLGAAPEDVSRLGGGHIHKNYRVQLGPIDLVVQQLNTHVFADLDAVQNNLVLVCDHLRSVGFPSLQPVPTVAGHLLFEAPGGSRWRAMHFVEGTSGNVAVDVDGLRAVSEFFGRFDDALSTLPVDALVETIPRFHDFGFRLSQLTDAITADRVGRVAACAQAIDRCMNAVVNLSAVEGWSEWHSLPRRLVHNDAKATNVMLDNSGVPVMVLDLDTCMAGTLLNDVGELVRSFGKQPQPLDFERVDAVLEGFRYGWGSDLTDEEVALLPLAGAKLAIENAVRFLADHLDGDRYFRLSGAQSNLARFLAEVGHGEDLLGYAAAR